MPYHGTPEFPRLGAFAYAETSPPDPVYNCIAWAVQDTSKWWWPFPYEPRCYWPSGLPKEETLISFIQAFATLGFHPCESSEFEDGLEKIALYVDAGGVPTHAARQIFGGAWTSKLGEGHDIQHRTLHDLEDGLYGNVAHFFSRQID